MPDDWSVRDSIQHGIALLTGIDSPRREAELLLCHVLECSQTNLITGSEKLLDKSKLETYFTLVERRSNGEPLAYVLGKQGFWKHDFIVSPEVLIPRPESELMVVTAAAST